MSYLRFFAQEKAIFFIIASKLELVLWGRS